MRRNLARRKLAYFTGDADIPLVTRLQIAFFVILDRECAREWLVLGEARIILREHAFPPSPDLSTSIMKLIYAQGEEVSFSEETLSEPGLLASLCSFFEQSDGPFAALEEIPLKSWIITGLVILASMMAFLSGGEDQRNIVPLGLTAGGIVSCYGALFIGTHLKELSERFGLRN